MTQNQPDRPLRIGMVCPYSFDTPGGVQAHAIGLCTALQAAGHHVSLIGPGGGSPELPDFFVPGGDSIAIPYNGSVARLRLGPKARRQLKQWLLAGQFDVLHIHEPNSPSFSMTALLLVEGPVVATYHSALERSWALRLAQPVLTPILEKITVGIAVSETARTWQVEQLGKNPLVIPNGIWVKDFQAAPEPADHPRICFLGRFDEPRKGMRVLIEAWPQIHAAHPTAELLVVGDGDADAVRRACRSGSEQITFLGRVSEAEKAQVLANSDIYVAPQTGGESFGIVLVEAMAAGAAVVASDLPAFSAVTKNGAAGTLCTTGCGRSFATAINRLLSDDNARRKLVAAGHARAREFDWGVLAADVTDVYRVLTATGAKVSVR